LCLRKLDFIFSEKILSSFPLALSFFKESPALSQWPRGLVVN